MIYMLGMKGCIHCENAKKALKDKIDSGNIIYKECDPKDPDLTCKILITSDILTGTPSFVYKTEYDGKDMMCKIDPKTMELENCEYVEEWFED